MTKRKGVIECRYKATETTKERYLTFRFSGLIQLVRKLYTIYKVGTCNSIIIHWDK